MRRILFSLPFLAVSWVTQAQETTVRQFMELPLSTRSIFMAGYGNGVLSAAALDSMRAGGATVFYERCLKNLSGRDLAGLVQTYVRRHPEVMDRPYDAVILASLMASCRF